MDNGKYGKKMDYCKNGLIDFGIGYGLNLKMDKWIFGLVNEKGLGLKWIWIWKNG